MTPVTRVLGTASLFLLVRAAHAAPLEVGPGKTYATPCAAFAAAATGDTIEIDAAGNGTYDGDVCAIAASGLTIRGVNGRAHIDANGNNSGGKATWVVQGDGVTVENVELSGASVPDHNGAGIRAEGNGLTIRNCYFHDNEEGILGGAGEVLIELSEFARNGNCIDPAGCAHNMYLSNSVTKFTLRYSYTHSVTDGHLVKSRAQSNYILENRITGEDGTDSYEIDLPNGGTAYVIGNMIEQGANTGNPTMLAYGEEGATNAGKDLYVVNNTFVNDRGSGTFVSVNGAVSPAIVKNNIFFGPGTTVNQGSAIVANNYTGDPMLVSRAGFDYHLVVGSPCINAGTDPGTGGSFSLVPTAEYVHPTSFRARPVVGILDIGAYEYDVGFDGGTGTGGTGNGAGGAPGNGGNTASGGSNGSGGAPTNGDASAGGTGNTNDGGAGSSSTGGGNLGGAGGSTNGGSSGSGTSGGGSGGRAAVGSGGTMTGTAGTTDAGLGAQSAEDTGGCGCRTVGRPSQSPAHLLALVSALVLVRRRRSRCNTSTGKF